MQEQVKVHILDGYDFDCCVYKEGEYSYADEYHPEYYAVPKELVDEYALVNKRREELKERLLLIKRQGPL